MKFIGVITVSVCIWMCSRCSEAFMLPPTTRSSSISSHRSTVMSGHYQAGPRQSQHRSPVRSGLRCRPSLANCTLGIRCGGAGQRRTETRVWMKGRSPSQLTEDELSQMARAREETNQKLEKFMLLKEALKAAKIEEERELNSAKVKERVRLEKEKADEAKKYIPQRLQEIEREEALLRSRVTDFNAKIKDTDVKQM